MMGIGAISFCVALLLVIPSDSPPVSSPSVVKGTFGDSVTLPCNGSAYKGLPDDQLDVLWQTSEGKPVARYSRGVHSTDSNFSLRFTFHTEKIRHGDFSITINSVNFSDADTYECVWRKGQGGQKFLSDVVLYVLKSHAVPSPSVVTRRFGALVTLPCNGSAYSGYRDDQLDVLWQTSEGEKVAHYSLGVHSVGVRFEQRVTFLTEKIRRGDFSITISSVKFSDEDTYECVWSKGQQRKEFLKDVKLYVLAPSFATSLSVPAGDSVTLPCYGNINKHAPEDLFVQWKRGDELVLNRSSKDVTYGRMYDGRASVSSDWIHGNFSLSLSVMGLCDEGVYQCSTDQNHNVTSFHLELEDYGHFEPVSLSLGKPFTLHLPEDPVNVTFSKEGTFPKVPVCSVDGVDFKCESKYKNRTELKNNTLIMQNLTLDDVGTYIVFLQENCVVKHAYRVNITHSKNNDQNHLLLLILLPIPERIFCSVLAVCIACYFVKVKIKKSWSAKAISDSALEGNKNLEEKANEQTPFKRPDPNDG